MWDLDIPRYAVTIGYEDNVACTMMTMAKNRPRKRGTLISNTRRSVNGQKNMIKIECVDTKMNVADMYTKQLGQLLFHRHCDYLMGRVPSSYSAVHQTFRDRCQPTKFSRGI